MPATAGNPDAAKQLETPETAATPSASWTVVTYRGVWVGARGLPAGRQRTKLVEPHDPGPAVRSPSLSTTPEATCFASEPAPLPYNLLWRRSESCDLEQTPCPEQLSKGPMLGFGRKQYGPASHSLQM